MPRDICAAKCGCLALLLLQVMGCTPGPNPDPGPPARASRPNILLAISDDQSWIHAGAYGDRGVDTPTFDRIARQGVLFNNAFAASPGCSPSRAALLTGRHTWQNEEAGTHASSFPKQLLTYPDLLEQAGYAVGFTGKGWGPGNWEISGRARNPAGPEFNARELEVPHDGIGLQDYAANFEDFLDSVPESGPFAFWYGGHEPHRIYENGVGLKVGKELSDAQVPPFLPDNDQIRSDILDYYVEIEWFDTQLKRMLDLLGERDLLHNTLVLVTSDNGMPFPRAKANGYEYGIHVPLAVAWPARVPGDRVVDDLVGFVDLAPTLLEVAGIETPTAMVGRSLLDILLSSADGLVDATRDRVFAARERHSSSRYDNWTYPDSGDENPRLPLHPQLRARSLAGRTPHRLRRRRVRLLRYRRRAKQECAHRRTGRSGGSGVLSSCGRASPRRRIVRRTPRSGESREPGRRPGLHGCPGTPCERAE